MSDKEFQKAIDELRELWKAYRTVHPSRKDKYYKKYVEKLDELAGATHMEIEDITNQRLKFVGWTIT